MELVRRANAYVRRKGCQADVELLRQTSADMLGKAFLELGPRAGVREALRAQGSPLPLKAALSNLLLFSGEVVGTDGARQQLRHEQRGDILRFGGLGAFVTANVADTRHPIMVVLHAGQHNGGAGGLNDEGDRETYNIDLLSECPIMPTAEEMPRIVAKNPVAQARFFIISMRLFCEHILGIGPVDEYLRHNGRQNGCYWPGGYAASAIAGGINMVAAFHGPIEEQARLSDHAHIVLQFVNRQSFAWLRNVLRMETESARQLLRRWQGATLRAVEALQITSAAIVPLHFVDRPDDAPELQGTPYTGDMRTEDRFDGELEADIKTPNSDACWRQ
jgi:hypothetical protein